MARLIRLADVAQARSGDKGDIANVALFAPTAALYEELRRQVTAERVRHHFGAFVRGRVERFEVPNVLALNFVLHEALGGGAARSLRSDALGKSFGSLLLRMSIEVDDAAVAGLGERLAGGSAPGPGRGDRG